MFRFRFIPVLGVCGSVRFVSGKQQLVLVMVPVGSFSADPIPVLFGSDCFRFGSVPPFRFGSHVFLLDILAFTSLATL